MSERGVFAVDRGVFEHPLFAPEPFTEREAWIWLFGSAAWKAKRTRVGRTFVNLERGQCAFATRFLAKRWKWAEARVRRFLKRLQSDASIVLQPTRHSTLITICNYDDYQFSGRTSDAQPDAREDTNLTHPRRKEEELKKDKKQEEENSSLRSDGWPKDFRELAWQAFPRKVAKKAAVRKIEAIRKSGEISWPAFIAAIQRHAVAMRGTEEKFIPHPATWLNGGRYLDGQPSAPSSSTGPPDWLTPEQRRDWEGGWRPGMRSRSEIQGAANGQAARAGIDTGGTSGPCDQGDLLASGAAFRPVQQH